MRSRDREVRLGAYCSYKQQVEQKQPGAKYKLITIALYDSAGDAEDYDGYHICLVWSSKSAGPTLPDWGDVEVNWKGRYPESRPTERQLKIYREYWRGLKVASKIAEAPFWDAKGVFRGKLEDQPIIDSREKTEVINLVADLCKRHNMRRSEMERLIAYVWSWRLGEKPTPERVEEWAKSFHEEWTE